MLLSVAVEVSDIHNKDMRSRSVGSKTEASPGKGVTNSHTQIISIHSLVGKPALFRSIRERIYSSEN